MKLKKTLSIFYLCIICVSTLSAQNDDKFTGSLLWKISGNGLNQSSYIVGTHHFFSGEFADSIPGLTAAFDDSEQVIGELLIQDFDSLQTKLLEDSKLDEGVSYDQLLSTEDYTKLDEGLKSLLGVGLDQFGIFNPGVIGIYLTRELYTKIVSGFDSESYEAIDIYLQNLAVSQGKMTFGLETLEDQTSALFDSDPLKDQAEGLVHAITHLKEVEDALRSLSQCYRSGDLNGLYKLSLNDPNDPMSSNQQANLLTNRNDNWIKQLPRTMEQASSLVVVGALHLAGQEGLLFQLDKMGYTVEPVK